MRSDFDKRVLGGGGVWYGPDLIVLIFLYVEGVDPKEIRDLYVRISSGGVVVTDSPLFCHEELSLSFRGDGQEVFFALCPEILKECKLDRYDTSFQVLNGVSVSRVMPIGVGV